MIQSGTREGKFHICKRPCIFLFHKHTKHEVFGDFSKASDRFPKIFEDSPKAALGYTNVFELFRKNSEECRILPRKIRRCFGYTPATLKALANEDTLLPTHCCRHIVADTNVSPFARARNICCGHKFCVRDTKNVSDFVQKHFVSAANVSQFAQPKKHQGQQCVRNNLSSFTRALSAGSNMTSNIGSSITVENYRKLRLFSGLEILVKHHIF